MSEKDVIEEFLAKARGLWLRADHVQTGDRILILSEPVEDAETFNKPYIVFKGRLLRTGAEYNIRLGTQNVVRVAETLGKAKDWVGNLLEVIAVENYPGLGKKGILFKGVRSITAPTAPAAPQPQPRQPRQPSPEAIKAIIDCRDVGEFGVPLNERDWSLLPAQVRAELLKLGYVKRIESAGEAYYMFDKEKCKEYWK